MAEIKLPPTRAFRELTLTEFTLMAAKHNKRSGIDLKGLFDGLQAFAAPQAPRWLPITVEAVIGKGHLLLRPSKASAACDWPKVAELVSSDRVPGEFEWAEEGGCSYSFECFDGYMPLTSLFALEEPK